MEMEFRLRQYGFNQRLFDTVISLTRVVKDLQEDNQNLLKRINDLERKVEQRCKNTSHS